MTGYFFIPSRKKKHDLLMLNGYTYCFIKNKKRWYCARKRNTNCTAKVILNDSGQIEFLDEVHCHARPRYYVTEDGQYILL